MPQLVATTRDLTQQLLDHLGVATTTLEVAEHDEIITVDITLPDQDSGLLIGYHGDTLNALQYLLGQLVNKGRDQWQRIIVNINHYRDQREAELRAMARNAADRALATGDEIEMPYLTAAERRSIHLELADRDDVKSFSEGEDRSRRLVVAPHSTD